MNTLTDREVIRLMATRPFPPHLKDWCIQVAHSANPTKQQLITARTVLNANSYERQQHWIFQDVWTKKPKITTHRIKNLRS